MDAGKIDYIFGKDDSDNTLDSICAKIGDAMSATVCPYCNRQHITRLTAYGKDIHTGDIDHFYCKSIHPYLALSVYYFIPSCQICNSRFKHTQDCFYAPHVNPHKHGLGSKARFIISDIAPYLDENAWNNSDNLLVIEVERTPVPPNLHELSPEAIENSIFTFHLNEV